MARPRVHEPAVEGRIERPHVDHPQAHDLAIARPGKDLPGVHPVRGAEMQHAAVGGPDAQRVRECRDAASAVAAHHPAGAVGIVVFHPEILVRIVLQDHEPVRANPAVRSPEAGLAVAQGGDARSVAEGGNILRPPVQDHEIIAGTGIFMQFRHQRNRSSSATEPAVFSSRYLTMTGQ